MCNKLHTCACVNWLYAYYQFLKLTRESTLMIGDVDRKCLQAHQEQKIKIKNKDRLGYSASMQEKKIKIYFRFKDGVHKTRLWIM